MTELSFLIELLLNHDLPKATKDLIASRIKEVESNLVTYKLPNQAQNVTPRLSQAPSTLAAMARHDMESPPAPPVLAPEIAQARQQSMDLVKKNKHPPMSTR